MAGDIYSSFSKFGAKSYLVVNKLAGYCTPSQTTVNVATPSSLESLATTSAGNSYNKTIAIQQQKSDYDVSSMLSKETGMKIICTIPCYCDIQFSIREFLTVLKYPDHPFTKRLESLAEDKQIKIN